MRSPLTVMLRSTGWAAAVAASVALKIKVSSNLFTYSSAIGDLLFELYIGIDDDFGEFLRLGLDELMKLLRRVRCRLEAHFLKLRNVLGHLESLHCRGVYFSQDRIRQIRRGEKTKEVYKLIAGKRRIFRDGRDIRHHGDARAGRDRDRAHLAAVNEGQRRTDTRIGHRDVLASDVRKLRRGAFVRHVIDFDAGHLVEELTCELLRIRSEERRVGKG